MKRHVVKDQKKLPVISGKHSLTWNTNQGTWERPWTIACEPIRDNSWESAALQALFKTNPKQRKCHGFKIIVRNIEDWDKFFYKYYFGRDDVTIENLQGNDTYPFPRKVVIPTYKKASSETSVPEQQPTYFLLPECFYFQSRSEFGKTSTT